jgi:hypothetical protein
MRIRSITELMRMTRDELCDLLVLVVVELPRFPTNSPESATAHINVQNIRAALGRLATYDR